MVVAAEDDLVRAAARSLSRVQRVFECGVVEEVGGGGAGAQATYSLELLAAVDELQCFAVVDWVFSVWEDGDSVNFYFWKNGDVFGVDVV